MNLITAIRRFTTQLEADGKSPLTIRVYKAELERMGRTLGTSVPVTRVRPETLANYLISAACRLGPDEEPRSQRTLNRAKTAIRLLFAYLVETGALKQSPARLLKNARLDRPLPTTLDAEEEQRFLRALGESRSAIDHRDEVLFTLLLKSGMRLSAALALKVEDLDLRAGTALTFGKHGRAQRVILNRDVVRLLGTHLKRTAITSGHIFRGRDGRLTSRQAQYRFHAVCRRAGITHPVTVHALRHTFATSLRRRTGDLRIVQCALGHRNLATTEVYASVDEDELRRAVAS